MKQKMVLICSWLLLVSPCLWASEFIYDTKSGQRLTLEEFAAARTAGEVVVFGEQHAIQGNENDPSTIVHHENQVRLLQALTAEAMASPRGASRMTVTSPRFHVTTAMEFLTYPKQELVDQYLAGTLAEADFLQQVGWSNGNPFAFYRAQILLPVQSQSHTVALNIPGAVASQVAQGGPDSLSADQRAFLPPIWERGSDAYFARFAAAMEDGHIPAEAVDRYFWAQSLWDDTMAWRALLNRAVDPLALTVIIVGEFHVDFGHGLPARLRRQQTDVPVRTLLQIEAADLAESTVAPLLEPDATYGPHADYLWVHTL